jgi:hypothetical protein
MNWRRERLEGEGVDFIVKGSMPHRPGKREQKIRSHGGEGRALSEVLVSEDHEQPFKI